MHCCEGLPTISMQGIDVPNRRLLAYKTNRDNYSVLIVFDCIIEINSLQQTKLKFSIKINQKVLVILYARHKILTSIKIIIGLPGGVWTISMSQKLK